MDTVRSVDLAAFAAVMAVIVVEPAADVAAVDVVAVAAVDAVAVVAVDAAVVVVDLDSAWSVVPVDFSLEKIARNPRFDSQNHWIGLVLSYPSVDRPGHFGGHLSVDFPSFARFD